MALLALCLIIATCIRDADPTPTPTIALSSTPASSTWVKIAPGGETRCAHNTPYAFWARAGDPQKLLVYFQGGGGCWDVATCAPGSSFYDPAVNESDRPGGRGGVLDLTHPRNPFRDHTIVFIPSCTGDVHWGDYVQSYPRSGDLPLRIYHRGYVNARAALAWLYTHYPSPEAIFVTGCSAGSVGSALFAPYVMERYPGARVTQLGDSLAFVFHRPVDMESDYRAGQNFPEWIPALQDLDPRAFTMAAFYTAVANHYPQARFSQFNTVRDRVQDRYYLAIGGQPGQFEADLQASLDEIHAHTDNFRSFSAGGNAHCVLPNGRFYSYAAQGVALRDWVADLAAGRDVPSVRCRDCAAAETLPPER